MAKLSASDVGHTLALRLKEARRESGLSARAVCDKLPPQVKVSHTTLTKFEKNVSAPGLTVLVALAKVYERPYQWFLYSDKEISGLRYRKFKSKIGVRELRSFESRIDRFTSAYLGLEERLGKALKPTKKMPSASSDIAGRRLAQSVRKQFGIEKTEPVLSVIDMIESYGIRVLALDTPKSIDGVAAKRGDELIVILNQETANDRFRLNAAHELAHVLYGDCDSDNDGELKEDEVEDRAYEFASALLLPQSQLREAFDGRSFVKLIRYKERFGISLSAMVYRAKKTNVISDTMARSIWVEMSKRGWKKKEPGAVWRERAVRFETTLDTAIWSNQLSWSEAAVITGICEDDLKNRLEWVYETGVLGAKGESF